MGPTFDRKIIKGYLSQKHKVKISQRRVALALQVVAPIYHQGRQANTARMINSIPYRTDYFGHKLHIDQNEKLVMYGVTHFVAIDGHSRFIPTGSTMPIKNNKTIYKRTFR